MKILIIHASAGAGHLKAGEAVYNYLKDRTDHDVVFVDALEYSSFVFKKTYAQIYFFMISKIPVVWDIAFRFLDLPFLQPFIRLGRRINNLLNTQKLHKYIINEKFDCIISSHFMPTEIVSSLKRKGKIASKLITIITDYDAHKIWLGSHVDQFAVATQWTKEKLISVGVPQEKLFVTGIPTDEKFRKEYDLLALKSQLGVKDGIFTVLMATGSFGIGPIEEAVQAIEGAQVIVVCGHNKTLYETLKKKQYENVVPFPLVNNMHELMSVSDAMVTKPGGMSISEALVKHLPMIFFSAIPGQETNNIMVLSQFNVGVKAFTIDKIVEEVNKLKSSEQALDQARQNIQRIANPNAVEKIVSLI